MAGPAEAVASQSMVPGMAVADQAAFLNTILHSSTEYSIIAEDLDGLILAWNEGARRIYGHEASDVVGKANASILHDPADLKNGRARAILDEVRATGKWAGELNRIRADGGGFTGFVTITLRRDAGGRPVGFTMISRDLTEAQRILRDLKESREYDRALIESNLDALMATDPVGIITDANRQVCAITGRTREELIGTPFKDCFTDPKWAENCIRRVLSENRVTNHELTIQAKDGREIVVSLNATTFKGADGRLRGVFATARDITDQKRLEVVRQDQNRELTETTSFLNNVLESSTEYSIIAKDLDGMILAWNEGARRNYGYSAEEMVGKQNSQVLHTPEDLESGRVRQFLDTALKTEKAEGVFERLRKDGLRFTAAVAVTLRRDSAGAPVGYVLISKDITDQKQLEEQLRQKNEELEDQNRRVQEANRLKSEFLANMSHELRTPLNGIIGFAELMHDGKVGAVSKDHKEYLGDILTSSRHLLQLINDVLDLSKVESGKMEFRPENVDLTKVVGEVRDIVRTLAAKKRLRVELEVDPDLTSVLIDPAKLKQVIYNYLSNAIKFTPDEGRVTVRARSEGAGSFRLEVEDTGIGIRPEDLGRLFVEFQQLDASATKRFQGTGLGLALTRRIVEGQGGKVGVLSTPGTGSTFFAIFPRVSKVRAEVTEEPLGSAPLLARDGAPRVLVVEDDGEDRAWMLRTLAEAGYATVAASSGGEAIRLAREQTFDAVTLDLLLPDLSGWDVLRAIRAEGPNMTIPAIVVTVVAEHGAGVGFQIQDLLVKPVRRADLLAVLERAGVQPRSDRSVLIVDDDPLVFKLVKPMLEEQGYQPMYAADAQSGLREAAARHPAVVLLDLLMPGTDGFEFLQEFRRTDVGRRTPVIVWTVKDLTAHERARLQASAQAVVAKGEGTTESLLVELRACIPAQPS